MRYMLRDRFIIGTLSSDQADVKKLLTDPYYRITGDGVGRYRFRLLNKRFAQAVSRLKKPSSLIHKPDGSFSTSGERKYL